MQIWAVGMVRDEQDIVELAVSNLIEQGVDRVLVADNLSQDGTGAILERLAVALPVCVIDDPDPAYRQSEKMTALAERAAAAGADWIIPFDADEIWRAYGGSIRDALARAESPLVAAQTFEHHPRPTWRRGDVIRRMPWNRTSPFAKVAFRWRPGITITQGNHGVDGIDADPQWGLLFLDHYPFRSWEQFRRKGRQGAAAVRAAGREMHHWERWDSLSGWQLRLAWWRIRLYPKLRRRDRGVVRVG